MATKDKSKLDIVEKPPLSKRLILSPRSRGVDGADVGGVGPCSVGDELPDDFRRIPDSPPGLVDTIRGGGRLDLELEGELETSLGELSNRKLGRRSRETASGTADDMNGLGGKRGLGGSDMDESLFFFLEISTADLSALSSAGAFSGSEENLCCCCSKLDDLALLREVVVLTGIKLGRYSFF
jgi:hypothetical protein